MVKDVWRPQTYQVRRYIAASFSGSDFSPGLETCLDRLERVRRLQCVSGQAWVGIPAEQVHCEGRLSCNTADWTTSCARMTPSCDEAGCESSPAYLSGGLLI